MGVVGEEKEDLVFMLWGCYGEKKGGFIEGKKDVVLSCVEGCGLWGYKGLFGKKDLSGRNE